MKPGDLVVHHVEINVKTCGAKDHGTIEGPAAMPGWWQVRWDSDGDLAHHPEANLTVCACSASKSVRL